MLLEELKPGLRIEGLIPAEVITVIAAQWHGADALELTYKTTAGGLGQQVVFRKDEGKLCVAQTGSRAFDAAGRDFKLVAEAQRITLAGLFDPMLAVATSDVQPLPHQIRAVYGELLPRTPLRFLLADDPGAGKTIMAGLYIKELLLRDDVKHCLIVAPGGLVEQWQDELFFKFGLRFDLLTNQLGRRQRQSQRLRDNPLLIARMDQLSRNEELQAQLKETEWDLVIVDEAHRMGAHYFGGKLEKTKRFQLGELLGDITRHLLLMTATPHSGKEEDFQLFLTLLDRDRFEGKYEARSRADTSGIMRRMVKEDLLTFEGKTLFPERIAETVPYELTALEQDLYEQVTDYVREGMNRADEARRQAQNTVGFALTVLQRRLASSPEAIYQSLVRRAERLERRKQEILDRHLPRTPEPDVSTSSDFDDDEYNAEEIEEIEEELARRRDRRADGRGAQRRAARTRRPDRGRRAGPRRRTPTASGPSCARSSQDNALTTDGERLAAQAHHLHRAPRHPRLPRSAGSARCSASPTRSRRSTAACAAASGARSPRSSPRTATARSCSPPTPPARA